MEDPVLQLSCETKQTGGSTIRHEQDNTRYAVSSIPFEVREQIRCHKGSYPV